VFVTGRSGEYGFADYSTIALQAATGKPLWKAIYDGPEGNEDVALAMGVSPDGSTVFVTGESGLTNTAHDYATLAYDAQTGAQLWLDRYGSPEGNDIARALEVSPDGATVFVTGQAGTAGDSDYVTIAYVAGP
jgi:outer membrane protein assembly factor BamB